jgi:hypothetical protein
MDGLGCSYLQLAAEVGYSYAHTRRLVGDLVAAGEVQIIPGIARSIRPTNRLSTTSAGGVAAEDGDWT